MSVDPTLHESLLRVNQQLMLIEKHIVQNAIQLDKSLHSQLDHSSFDGMIDYELKVTVECYTRGNEYPLCALHEYLKYISVPNHSKLTKLADETNHNEYEFHQSHPMKDEIHCWLFHALYDHEHLSWEEIASIETFRVDLKPVYQYRFTMLNNSGFVENKHLIYSNNYRFGFLDIFKEQMKSLFRNYPLDLWKFEKIKSHLHDHIANIPLNPISDDALSEFHTQEYLRSIRDDKSTIESIAAFAIPDFITVSQANELLVDSARSMVAGTVHASELAFKTGWAINIGGGFHHARSEHGGGFCFFNDYAIATYHLRKTHPDLKILYIDLDAHFGDGVLSFAKSTKNFYILDLYNTFTDFELDCTIKQDDQKRFTLIGLKTYAQDKIYIKLLKEHLPAVIEAVHPDIIFYNGGSDVLRGDPLGHLSISPEGMLERDLFVFGEAKTRSIPIMMCLSGGYGKENYFHVCKSIEAIIGMMG